MQENNKKNRDYESEIKEVFDEALNEIDPELLKDIQLVFEMNVDCVNKIEVSNSYSGTTTE